MKFYCIHKTCVGLNAVWRRANWAGRRDSRFAFAGGVPKCPCTIGKSGLWPPRPHVQNERREVGFLPVIKDGDPALKLT